jgi:peptidoglycan hydrolase-like protein with peptidoglycan-binding domain
MWPKVTVRSLQYLLNAHGARLAVDGIFGPLTNTAVRSFQASHHLPVTGVVDGQTWPALIIAISRGSVGSAVKAAQDQLNFRNLRGTGLLALDGIFGPLTQRSVLSFQKGVGLVPDGIVGPLTWRALISEFLSG